MSIWNFRNLQFPSGSGGPQSVQQQIFAPAVGQTTGGISNVQGTLGIAGAIISAVNGGLTLVSGTLSSVLQTVAAPITNSSGVVGITFASPFVNSGGVLNLSSTLPLATVAGSLSLEYQAPLYLPDSVHLGVSLTAPVINSSGAIGVSLTAPILNTGGAIGITFTAPFVNTGGVLNLSSILPLATRRWRAESGISGPTLPARWHSPWLGVEQQRRIVGEQPRPACGEHGCRAWLGW